MTTLPTLLPFAPSTVDIMVRDKVDVLAVLPAEYKEGGGPILSALASGLLGMLTEHQKAAEYASAQSDITRANGMYLDGLAGDLGSNRAPGERDEAYRRRTLGLREIASPAAILAIANIILGPVTTRKAQLSEAILDRFYLNDGPEGYSVFLGDGISDMNPRYPDRLYEDDAEFNDGFVRMQSAPGGPLLFADAFGRMFVLRVPELNDINAPRSFIFVDDADTSSLGMFVEFDEIGVDRSGGAFISNNYMTADDTYQSIADAVQQTKGHGIRFLLLVDRKL